jgi:hypothetical protein
MNRSFARATLFALAVFAAASASATQPGNNGGGHGGCGVGQQTNGCGGGTPSTPAPSSTSTSSAQASAAAAALGVGVGVANAAGGAGGAGGHGGMGGAGGSAQSAANAAGGTSAAEGGNVDLSGARLGGAVVFERSAPSVSVGTPTAPILDCRRTIALGASSTGGSGVASGIPLWKEGDCAAMMALDGQIRAGNGAFTVIDRRHVACKIEANADTKTCQDLKAQQRAAAEAMRPVATGPASPMMP